MKISLSAAAQTVTIYDTIYKINIAIAITIVISLVI